jgi:hypothetical protein
MRNLRCLSWTQKWVAVPSMNSVPSGLGQK